ncbi:hypothetical protein [Nonomuraea sp. NPDC003214]
MSGAGPALAVIAGSGLVIVALAMMCDARRQARALRRENTRLQNRLRTYTRILAPLPAALRDKRKLDAIPHHDLVVLSLLVEKEGPDGDELAALEALLHETPDP